MKKIIVDNFINGNPHLSKTEFTVLDIVSDCCYEGVDEFLLANPEISIDEVVLTLDFCKNRNCNKSGGHCGGCSLRLLDDGINNLKDFINQFSEIRFLECNEVVEGEGKGIMVMPGKKDDLDSNWKGVNGWEMASKVLKKGKF